MNVEKLIFENLILNEAYNRKTLPFLKSEYFKTPTDQIIFNLIKSYVDKYTNFPTKEALAIDLGALSNITEQQYKDCLNLIESFEKSEKDVDWLTDKTETFCQDRAIYLALQKSIGIINNEQGQQLSKGAIPAILTEALSVSFDPSVGHDFFEDAEHRYEAYHHKEKKVPFDIDFFNRITDNGFEAKSLNVIMAGTGVGKTLIMCHMAAYNLMQGLNVLYITQEMSDMKISERIEANLFDVPINDIKLLPKNSYAKNIFNIKQATKGKLIVKEYPTASAGANHFRYLLNELKIKKEFVPDIIYVDYLNICMSSRLKAAASANSTYTYVKFIAEELRGLAVEFNVPVVTATQVNRMGFSDSDFGLEHTSESFGLPATCDFMIGAITTEGLDQLGQIEFKQLKNRYNDPNKYKRFIVGIDRPKMRLYNVEQSAQKDIDVDEPVMEKTGFDREKFKDFL